MNPYLIIKWLHIVSSVVLVGIGFGSAFYLFFVNRSKSIPAIAVVTRLVVRADWWFTTPAIIVQPLTGLWMIHLAQLTWQPWILISIGLYIFAGACWLPVVWIQIKMSQIAAHALAENTPLPRQYWRYARIWECLGYPAFIALLYVFFLMTVKPDFSFS